MDSLDPAATGLVIAIVAALIALIIIVVLTTKLSNLKRENVGNQEMVLQLQEQIGAVQGNLHQLEVNLQGKAQELYQSWVQRDCEAIRKNEKEVALLAASTQLEQWKYESEMIIRNDAIQRSHSVILGQVTEHLVPFMPDFQFNPKDVRFVGSPIDLVVFDGMDEGDLRQVVFVEVKTGASAALTKRERRIRDVISAGQVKWTELRIARNDRSQLPATVNEVVEEPSTDPLIDHLIVHGWDVYSRGTVKFEDWADEMRTRFKDFGDQIEPHLQNVWAQITEAVGRTDSTQPKAPR